MNFMQDTTKDTHNQNVPINNLMENSEIKKYRSQNLGGMDSS